MGIYSLKIVFQKFSYITQNIKLLINLCLKNEINTIVNIFTTEIHRWLNYEVLRRCPAGTQHL